MITSFPLPRMIERGVTTTLTLELYDDDGVTPLTPSSGGTVDVYAGSTLILDGGTVTAGTTSTATLLGSATSGQTLADTWLEQWSVTVGGVAHVVRRSAYLVRHVLYPVVRVRDLLDRHSDLDGQGDLQHLLDAAWNDIQRELIRKGNRPQLIVDSWALFDMHVARTLQMAFRDAHQRIGDGRYLELSAAYAADYARAWDTTEFRYDFDEDGTLSETERKPAEVSVIWTGRPPSDRWWSR